MVSKISDVAGDRVRRSGRSVHYNISYVVQGAEHGTDGAIVLLHDVVGGAFAWEEIMGRLGGLKRAIYAFDMLGFGESERPWPADTSVWGQADVLSYLFKDLGLTNVVLVGHGFGGGVAQILATRLYREQTQSLVLINSICYLYTFAENWPMTEIEKRREFDAAEHTSVEDFISNLRSTLPAAVIDTKRFERVISSYVEPWNNKLGKEVFFQQLRNLVPFYMNSVSSDLKVLGKPTLLLWGEKDEQVPVKFAQRLNREIPQSQLITVPDAGHMILFDAPGQVEQALIDFVKEL